MLVKILIDNTPHPQQNMLSEHGLSIYIEHENKKYLFDTGASEAFAQNASKMEVDLKTIDYVIISHGHGDHAGGLEQFLKINDQAEIYISEKIIGQNFFSYRYDTKWNVSLNHDIIKQHIERFKFIGNNSLIAEGVALMTHIPHHHALPKGNNTLYVESNNTEEKDDFQHEISLAFESYGRVVVFSGCSHNGLLNIVDACAGFFENAQVVACIGGTHLVDCLKHRQCESEEELLQIANEITIRYPLMDLSTGHCTGIKAKKILQESLGKKFFWFHTGTEIKI